MRPSPSLLLLLSTIAAVSAAGVSTILFNSIGRSRYAFDIFSVPLPLTHPAAELRHTHSDTVNFNGHFPSPAAISQLPTSHGRFPLLFVSELNGSSNVYLDSIPEQESRRSALGAPLPRRPSPYPLLADNGGVSMKDRPSIAGHRLIYVSSHEKSAVSRESWAAVYSTHLNTRETVRLTPRGVAAFSPSVPPSGEWTAVASSGERGWTGEKEDLVTDIYVFRTRDGSERTRVVVHG